MVDEAAWLGIVQTNMDCQKNKSESCWKTALTSMETLAKEIKEKKAAAAT